MSTAGVPNIRIDMNKVGLPLGMITSSDDKPKPKPKPKPKRLERLAATASRSGLMPVVGV